MQLKQAMGILGGTFDPIHFGHLRTALELLQSLSLAHVRLLPCYQPVHRKQPSASPEDRLAMVQAAIHHTSGLVVDTTEIDRKGPSYTIDTLNHLRTENPHTPFCLIMGIDALLGFPSWHQWQSILELAHLVIAHRPLYHLPQTGVVATLLKERLTHDKKTLHESLAGRILLHPVTALDISATDIRKQIAQGKSPQFLLPDAVAEYIKTHGVYSLDQL